MRAKKDVNTIIDKGTPRERINLYYSYRAERDRGITPPLLTKEEISRLMESFKTSREIALFDRYVNINRDVQKTIVHLNQLQLAYREQIAYGRGIEALWDAFIGNAKLLNKILQRVKDEDVREEILNDILNHPAQYPLEYARDGERIIIKTTSKKEEPETDLEAVIRIRKALSVNILTMAKAIFKAVRDYMREKGFKIKVYQNQLKAIEKDLRENKPLSERVDFQWVMYPPTYDEIELNEEACKDYRETYFHE